jgi:hypothetical protein
MRSPNFALALIAIHPKVHDPNDQRMQTLTKLLMMFAHSEREFIKMLLLSQSHTNLSSGMLAIMNSSLKQWHKVLAKSLTQNVTP